MIWLEYNPRNFYLSNNKIWLTGLLGIWNITICVGVETKKQPVGVEMSHVRKLSKRADISRFAHVTHHTALKNPQHSLLGIELGSMISLPTGKRRSEWILGNVMLNIFSRARHIYSPCIPRRSWRRNGTRTICHCTRRRACRPAGVERGF